MRGASEIATDSSAANSVFERSLTAGNNSFGRFHRHMQTQRAPDQLNNSPGAGCGFSKFQLRAGQLVPEVDDVRDVPSQRRERVNNDVRDMISAKLPKGG